MSQPVRLPDELVLDARRTAKVTERSIAGQISYWAKLGQAIEPHLEGAEAISLSRASAATPLSACFEAVDSEEGLQRIHEHLNEQPFPHYEPVEDKRGFLVRIEEDGTRTLGRFVHRRFVEAEQEADA